MKLSKYIIACAVYMLASVANAQDTKEFTDLRADNARLTQTIGTAEAELNKQNARIESYESDIEAAKQALESAQSEKSKATVAFAADPTPANKRVADRANSSLLLAERKLASLKKRFNFSIEKKTEAENQITGSMERIAANTRRLEQLRQEIALQQEAKRQSAEERSAQAAAEQAAREKAEAERLAKIKLEQQKEEKQAKVEEEQKSKLSAEELARVDLAKEAVKNLDDYLGGDVSKRGSIRRPILSSSKDGRFDMEHLGGEIYMVEVSLSAGEHKMAVDSNRYLVVIGESDNKQKFRIYFDNRDPSKRRLMSFKSALLEYTP